MKIPDSIIMQQSPLSSSEQYPSKESLKAFPAMHNNDLKSGISRTSDVSDVVSLTLQAKLSSKQTYSIANLNSDDQLVTDFESRGSEAIVQLIEMLTGIKVKLLNPADFVDEAEKRRKDFSKLNEVQQIPDSMPDVSKYLSVPDGSAFLTEGAFKFADGKEVSFSLDIVLPKEVVNTVA
jgi:hypothetical protein